MTKLYKPTIYAKNIFEINYSKLKEKNIKYLLFDIDNTIADNSEKDPSSEIISLFKTLQEQGFKLVIITNSLPHRALRFAKKLNVKAYYLSFKPLSYNYRRIFRKIKVSPNKIAAIGDQILTDIKGANKHNITSILVDKISSNESFITKLNRYKENRLINKYHIIKRGEYYE